MSLEVIYLIILCQDIFIDLAYPLLMYQGCCIGVLCLCICVCFLHLFLGSPSSVSIFYSYCNLFVFALIYKNSYYIILQLFLLYAYLLSNDIYIYKGYDLDWRQLRRNLGCWERETIIGIYCMERIYIQLKKKKNLDNEKRK